MDGAAVRSHGGQRPARARRQTGECVVGGKKRAAHILSRSRNHFGDTGLLRDVLHGLSVTLSLLRIPSPHMLHVIQIKYKAARCTCQ